VGAGYAAAQSPTSALSSQTASADKLDQTDGRDYHYGVAPQALANLRLIAGRRAALDLTAREYFISTVGGFGTGQRDLIFVGDASLAIRILSKARARSHLSTCPPQLGPSHGSHAGAVDRRRLLHVARVGRLRHGAVGVFWQTYFAGGEGW
jgi:hypothetical protein